jgi:hypothetical protein
MFTTHKKTGEEDFNRMDGKKQPKIGKHNECNRAKD